MNNNRLEKQVREIHQYVKDEAGFLRRHLTSLLRGRITKETRYLILDYVTYKFNSVGRKLEAVYKHENKIQPNTATYDEKTATLLFIRHILADDIVEHNPTLKHYLEELFLSICENEERNIPYSDVYLDIFREATRIAIKGLK